MAGKPDGAPTRPAAVVGPLHRTDSLGYSGMDQAYELMYGSPAALRTPALLTAGLGPGGADGAGSSYFPGPDGGPAPSVNATATAAGRARPGQSMTLTLPTMPQRRPPEDGTDVGALPLLPALNTPPIGLDPGSLDYLLNGVTAARRLTGRSLTDGGVGGIAGGNGGAGAPAFANDKDSDTAASILQAISSPPIPTTEENVFEKTMRLHAVRPTLLPVASSHLTTPATVAYGGVPVLVPSSSSSAAAAAMLVPDLAVADAAVPRKRKGEPEDAALLEQKRARRRERCREAANKFRSKKRLQVQGLEQAAAAAQIAHAQLVQEVINLKQKVLDLKGFALLHRECAGLASAAPLPATATAAGKMGPA
jgi:hypothetical protein